MVAHLRKLLVLGALLWVAPVSGEQRVNSEFGSGTGTSGCPDKAEVRGTNRVMIKAPPTVMESRGPSAALLP